MKDEESVDLVKPIQSIIKAIKNTQAIQEIINEGGASLNNQDPQKRDIRTLSEAIEIGTSGISVNEKLSSKPKRKAHQEA